jgi:hypothetical protein
MPIYGTNVVMDRTGTDIQQTTPGQRERNRIIEYEIFPAKV